MDKWNALHKFWNSFGIPAYDETTVPDGAKTPYITYEAAIADLDERAVLVASIWYTSNSWAEISQKAEEISTRIGGGYGEPFDGGRLWVTKGAPFAQRMEEPSDRLTRRIILNIVAEYQ